jgi:hypothetical protein
MKKSKLTAIIVQSQSTTAILSAKDRIKPRGLAGLYKDKIHYDEKSDIFNLAPL